MAAKPSRSEFQDAARKTQCDWLLSLKAKTGLSMTEISRRAGLHPGTLNRFLNDDERGATLHAQTITAVANAVGMAPPGGSTFGGETPAVLRGLRESDAEPYAATSGDPRAEAVKALLAGKAARVPWEMRSRALEMEGYKPGDVLIVDLNEPARPGDVVCAQIYDWQNHAATQTVFRVYEAPFLVSGSFERTDRRPRLVDGETVVIKGVVTDMVRFARG